MVFFPTITIQFHIDLGTFFFADFQGTTFFFREKKQQPKIPNGPPPPSP